MSAADARRGLGLVALSCCLVACYRSRAPERWLPTPVEAGSNPFGGWITLSVASPDGPRTLDGELIAAEGDSVHVLGLSGIQSLALADVTDLKLEMFRVERVGLVTWTTLGIVASLSHGFVLVLTAPLWAIVGTAATSAYSHAPVVTTRNVAALRSYARFPQGFPPGVDRSTLIGPPPLERSYQSER